MHVIVQSNEPCETLVWATQTTTLYETSLQEHGSVHNHRIWR